MTDFVYGGGWGVAAERMSPRLRAEVDRADAAYERESAQQEVIRAARAEVFHERSVAASIGAALEAGEVFSVPEAIRAGGRGRTRGEALAFFSAVQDHEDARAAAVARREMRRLGVDEVTYCAERSADTSAPSAAEVAADEALLERGRARAAHRREVAKIVSGHLRVAEMRRRGVRRG